MEDDARAGSSTSGIARARRASMNPSGLKAGMRWPAFSLAAHGVLRLRAASQFTTSVLWPKRSVAINSNVHADVQALAGAGFSTTRAKACAPLHAIETKIGNLKSTSHDDGENSGLGIGSWALDINHSVVGDGMERMNIISNNIAFIESLLRHSFQTQKFRSRHLGQMGIFLSSSGVRKHKSMFLCVSMNTSATS